MAASRLWFLAGALALGGVMASGCATTGLDDVWSKPGFDRPMNSLLVIAMKRQETNRRIMEDAFVRELAKYGVAGTPSYGEFPGALPDTEAVRQYVLANHFQGVLVAARLPTESVTQNLPGYTTTEARTAYNTWTGRYYTYYVEVEREGTTQTQRVVPHRVDVWYSDGKGGQMVWSAQTRSVDPSSSSQVSKEMCEEVVPAMAKAGIVPSKPSGR